MGNSSRVVVLTASDGRDYMLISLISTLIKRGHEPIILNGLSRESLRSTAYVLKLSLLKFPPNTMFIVLNHITPSTVIAHYDGKIIITPNNGLITMISETLDNEKIFSSISVFDEPLPILLQTKELSSLLSEERKGKIVEAFIPQPVVNKTENSITATIIHIDSTGNVITNINNIENFKLLSTLAVKSFEFIKKNVTLFHFDFTSVYPTYPFHETPGKQVVFLDEMGYVSCGIIGGNLAEILNLNEYVQIRIKLKQDTETPVKPFLSIPKNTIS